MTDKEDYEFLMTKHQKIIDQEYRRLLKRDHVPLSDEEKEATRIRKNARKMVQPDFGLAELELAEKVISDLK